MSGLQASNDVDFIKAQITKDDKELREIIKEKTRATTGPNTTSTSRPSSTQSGVKSTRSSSAKPQRAVLMDMDLGLYPDFHSPRATSPGNKQPQMGFHRPSWKPRPTARA